MFKQLQEICINVENHAAKLLIHYRTKRALINVLGSAIKFITGNLDDNDLQDIKSNLNKLYLNDKKVITKISELTSFANHLTERYSKDMQIVSENQNLTMKAIN